MRAEINISKIQAGSGVAGAIVALSVIAIALIGLPEARLFLMGSLGAGVVVAVVLRLTARGRT